MNGNNRLQWKLFALIILFFSAYALLLIYVPRWLGMQTANRPSCLKVSDFYSVHLTTYFLAATWGSDMDSKSQGKRYDQYCDRIPGIGKAIFTVDLMEQDARALSVALSLSQYNARGQLRLVKELPPNPHPRGVLTLDTAIVEQGKYLLKVAFGEAKSKDDIIEVPILVGQ